jgi:LmbE family N-acetylglucosaminyl deacetylase
MLKPKFVGSAGRALRILCLGAHADDVEIGCGGTIMRMISENKQPEVYWVVFSALGQRRREARTSARIVLAELQKKTIVTKGFRDGFFPFEGIAIKDEFEALSRLFSPDLIFTHYRDDRHQDHRLISDLTWNTFRDHLILEYEIPKYDGDLGSPNFFMDLDESICRKKCKHILKSFESQKTKSWFTEETFMSLGWIRGMESRSTGKYAEAFYCRKITF